MAFPTDDPIAVLRYARDSFLQGMPVALITLVEIVGGAARPLGAHMTVRMDGLFCGFVSGGCTEAAIAAEALLAINGGHDRFLRLGEGSPFFDIVLPCGGGLQLSIHVLKGVDAIEAVLTDLDARRKASLTYNPQAETLTFDPVARTGWNAETFSVLYRPSLRIVLGGRSLELETTLSVARAAGYLVQVIDERDDGLEIDEDCAVALLFHDLEREIPVLERALASPAFYLGALGSRRTHAKRCETLRRLHHSDQSIARIKAPIGIFDSARNASSLALSIVADISSSHARVRSTQPT